MRRRVLQSGESTLETTGCLLFLGAIAGLMIWGWISWRDAGWYFWRDCPFGAELAGDHPPRGRKEWCQKETAAGEFVKHGRSRLWNSEGKLVVEGDFDDGTPSGDWRIREANGSFRELSAAALRDRFDLLGGNSGPVRPAAEQSVSAPPSASAVSPKFAPGSADAKDADPAEGLYDTPPPKPRAGDEAAEGL